MLASFHLIVSAFLQLFDDFVELADLRIQNLIPSNEFFDKFFQVHPIDICRVSGLTDSNKLTNILHFLAEPLVLLVDKIILFGKLCNGVLCQVAVEVQFDLVEVLSTTIELPEATNLLISYLETSLQIFDLLD